MQINREIRTIIIIIIKEYLVQLRKSIDSLM